MTRPFTDDGGHGGAPGPRGDPLVLADRYELVELLGRGGMAEVHKAHDRSLHRVVAVKLLPADRRQDDTQTRRLHDEARAAAGLGHPNIIAVHDVGTSPYGLYVVMELLDGRPWRDELRARGRVPELEAVEVGAAVARALAHAHAHGVVHRDVNPANVMVLADATVRLMDFGIAQLADVGGLTETGHVVGTAAYMSPEQVLGEPLDGRSDVYSLGCTLYEALTGTPPFRGDGSSEVASARLHRPPVPPRQLRGELSVGAEDLVLRAMSRQPPARPDAASLAEALEDLARRHRRGGPGPAEEGVATEVLDAGSGGRGSSPRRSPPGPRVDDEDPAPDEGPDGAPDVRIPTPGATLRRVGTALVVLGVLAIVVVGVLLLALR